MPSPSSGVWQVGIPHASMPPLNEAEAGVHAAGHDLHYGAVRLGQHVQPMRKAGGHTSWPRSKKRRWASMLQAMASRNSKRLRLSSSVSFLAHSKRASSAQVCRPHTCASHSSRVDLTCRPHMQCRLLLAAVQLPGQAPGPHRLDPFPQPMDAYSTCASHSSRVDVTCGAHMQRCLLSSGRQQADT